ncbi:epimerase [Termitidicoccus mucosus]|uniref:Epimerase n=1 Tax=Termitidicoccus mucosus TaxID=1184151 RepID=A0A178IKV9_9BACT|nr:epimerase [Opitutaceae bacterium TSB47]
MTKAAVNLPPPPCTAGTADDFLSEPAPATIEAVAAMPRGPVAILGAGGKMGLHLSLMLKKAAVAAGQPERRVIAISRFASLRDRGGFEAAGITTIPCDLSVPVNVAALPDASVVFFLAGVKFGTASSPLLLEQMNVTVPKLVAARYKDSRMVVFSTGCVYPFAPVNTRGCTESTPPAPVGDYAQSCLRREQIFAAASAAHGTSVVLIRLNYAVEFRYGVLVDIATKVRDGLPVDVTMGHVNIIWQPDALNHIIRAASIAASPAVPLNITGSGVHRVRDIAADFGAFLGAAPVITGDEATTAWLNDASHSHRLFGLPPTSPGTMRQWIASWLASGGHTWGKPTGFEKRDGKF